METCFISTKMPSRNNEDKRPATPDVEFEAGHDFLEDPSLWLDRLPQPFRLVDEILSLTLETAWQSIERRETARRQERRRVAVPEAAAGVEVVGGTEGATAVACGKDGLVYIATSSSISVCSRDGTGWNKLLQQDFATEEEDGGVSKLRIGCHGNITFLAALTGARVSLFAHVRDHLELVNQTTAQVDGSTIIDVFLSPTSSHVSLATAPPPPSEASTPTQLEVYKLPLDTWSKELEHLSATQLESESQLSVASRKNREERREASYSKPVFQFCLQPPSPLAASAAKDVPTALQNVLDASCEHLATGEQHILSEHYFESRRKAFVSTRTDFASEVAPVVSLEQSTPTIHYLYYKDRARLSSPCYVAVWWSSHSQLLLYALDTPTKVGVGAPPLYRVLPQSCAVVASAVSLDSSLLALALQSGVVAVWNFKTGLCVNVVSAVCEAEEEVSSVDFLPSPDAVLLAIGTTRGHVLLASCDHSCQATVKPLNPRTDASKVVSLKVNLSLPATVTSVHADGSMVLWSEMGALCRLVLPPSLVAAHDCCFTADGRQLLVMVGEQDTPSYERMVAAFALSSVGELSAYWSGSVGTTTPPLWGEPAPSLAMAERVERSLVEFTKQALETVQSKRWQRRWAEFSQELLHSQA